MPGAATAEFVQGKIVCNLLYSGTTSYILKLKAGMRIWIRKDPLIFGLPDQLLFSSDPDPTITTDL